MAIPEFIVFLHCARRSRILAKACPEEAAQHKSCCRFWVEMARRAQPPPLP
ncbi:hypothetical protein [Microvirga zambiensis]|uniref:hypothetical protein n=1 Tax=Microvirga zambiensis TaxID=1402137 RepID=UPI00191FD0EF|nr:hypothetical protein [Microvirga zambiensis]